MNEKLQELNCNNKILEKRKEKRFDIETVAILENGNQIIRGYLKNLSMTGAYFTTYDELTEDINFGKFRIIKDFEFLNTLSSKIVRKTSLGEDSLQNFDYGLEFTENEDKIKKVVNSLIKF